MSVISTNIELVSQQAGRTGFIPGETTDRFSLPDFQQVFDFNHAFQLFHRSLS